ncbi:uncharacterized protein LOC107305276 [Oryza brachyantha]|uniref:Uncharacterized protein n=1 Tax=Oryza brachyantha TaxID=4533 RepID=J3N8L1_ORYBR|nr:uncharacterized protein LOC107305276 [Oryza brachyantha]
MGCSTSKLEPEDQLDVAPASSKPAAPRRGFASDLFGRARRSNNVSKSSGTDVAAGDHPQKQQQKQQEEGQPRQQATKKGGAGGATGRELARSPGSPSFRYYCENAAGAAAFAEPKKERR